MEELFQSLYEKLHYIFFFEEDIKDKELKNKLYVKDTNNALDEKYFNIFIDFILYIIYENNSLNIFSNPDSIYRLEDGLDFNTFRSKLNTFKKLGNQNAYDALHSSIIKRINEHDFWYSINSSMIRNEDDLEPFTEILYIPVDNSYLFLLSTLMMTGFEREGIQYRMKVNVDNKQYGNNMEVYVNENTCHIVLNVLEEVLSKYSKIKINANQIPEVSYKINDTVGIVPVLTNNSKYEDVICEDIIKVKNDLKEKDGSNSFDTFIEEFDSFLKFYFKEIEKRYIKPNNNDKKLQ